jgi:hypothetical protein
MHYEKAFKRPFTDLKKLGIGVLLYIIPILNIVGAFFVMGYFMKAAKLTQKKKFNLPEWDDWGDLILKGLISAAIFIIWSMPAIIITFIVLTIFIGSAIVAGVSGSSLAATQQGSAAELLALATGTGIIGILILLVVFLFTSYVSPVALQAFIDTGKFNSALQIKAIIKKAFTQTWFVAWIVAASWGVLFLIIAGLLIVVSAILIPYEWVNFVIWTLIIRTATVISGIQGTTLHAEAFKKI